MSQPSRIDPWTALTPNDVDAAVVALGCLSSRPADEGGLQLKAYHVALEGATRHGLTQAVKRILQGALGHPFMPNPAELRMQHDAVMKPYRETLEREERAKQMAEEAARFAPRSRHHGERERVMAIYRRFQQHCADVDCPPDLDALRAKYDPALLDRIPDRTDASPQGFERVRYRNG